MSIHCCQGLFLFARSYNKTRVALFRKQFRNPTFPVHPKYDVRLYFDMLYSRSFQTGENPSVVLKRQLFLQQQKDRGVIFRNRKACRACILNGEWRSSRTHSISRVSNSITDDLSGLPCGEEDVVPDADTRDGECITIRQRPCTYCTRCAERHDVDVPLWYSGNPGCVRWIKGGFLLHQQTCPAVFSFRVQLVSYFRVDSRVVCSFFTQLKSG